MDFFNALLEPHCWSRDDFLINQADSLAADCLDQAKARLLVDVIPGDRVHPADLAEEDIYLLSPGEESFLAIWGNVAGIACFCILCNISSPTVFKRVDGDGGGGKGLHLAVDSLEIDSGTVIVVGQGCGQLLKP